MNTVTAILVLCQAAISDPFPATARAIMFAESGGDPYAVGDSGRALGPYQIHRAYWQDGTRFLGVSWAYDDARDPVKAMAVVRAYTQRYAEAYGLPWTPEIIARIHNGGPRGYRKASTLKYWRKVRRIMVEQER